MNDPHLALLEFFPSSKDIFKDVAIADGLSIVLKIWKRMNVDLHINIL